MAESPRWLSEESLQQLFAATAAAGGEARVVGGAVRDFLLKREGGDVDVASSLPPEITVQIAAQQGWKAVPTGIEHGTVTLVLPTRVVEVTTLRRDVETDGRHAKIVYTDNFAEDAARRDFTMNALSMDANGTIHDYYDGLTDLKAQRVRFIGDAATRITEDALRILRFFRFLATHGKPPANPEAIAAIAMHKHLLANLSGERIAQEMRKLLSAVEPVYALEHMRGLADYLTHAVWDQQPLETDVRDPWVRLLSMINPTARVEAAKWIGERWKLSRIERDTLIMLAEPVTLSGPNVKAWLRRYSQSQVIGRILLQGGNAVLLQLARQWQVPAFPVTAADLLARGATQGKALGDALKALETKWEESDYQLSREQLLGA